MDGVTTPIAQSILAPNDLTAGSHHHPVHYYEDGNIIFVAGEEKMQFRFYRGILARQSEVMRNMFALPDGAVDSQETIDGVPAVHLTDSVEDLSRLFDFLMAPNIPPYPPKTPDFEILLSVLRVSSKYMFDDVRERVLFHLRQTIPTTRADFIQNPQLTMFTGIKASQAVAMSRDFDLPEFVPLALYAITTYSWKDINAADLVYAALPAADLARVVVGRNALHGEALRLAFTMHEHGLAASPACPTQVSIARSCARGKPTQIWSNPELELEEFLRNPLKTLAMRNHFPFHGLCKSCGDSLRMKMAADFQELFDKLPQIFNLR